MYEVSNLGRVKVLKRRWVPKDRILNLGKLLSRKKVNKNTGLNYSTASVFNKTYTVHGLVMLAFVGKRPVGKFINHIDGNGLNNALDNLEYCTPQENHNHAREVLGVSFIRIGEINGMSKLSNKDVLKIRELYETGKYSQKELGAKFGICQSVTSSIVRKEIWRHI